MKKTLKFALVFAVVAVMAALSAFAATTTFRMEAYDEAANQYDLYVNVAMGEGGCVNTHTVKFTFNSDKLILADTDYEPITDLTTAADAPILPLETQVGKKKYSYNFVGVTWTPNGNKTQAYITAYTTDGAQFDASNLDLYTVSFKLADGITLADITPDDFVVDYNYISDTHLGEFGFNQPAASQVAEIVNNVVTEPAEDAKITIPAGSAVYFADGTKEVYAEETEVTVPKAEGFMIVNDGFTSQKVYKVAADGTYTEVAGLENAVLGLNVASIRTTGVQGIRFASTALNSALALTQAADNYEITEYGYVITAESTANALPADYELNMALVNAGKAKKGVAYSKETGKKITYSEDETNTVFTAVLTNVPKTAAALQTKIVSRPYYVINGTSVAYGETTSRSLYEIAKLIKEATGADYTNNKAYIDEIITIVEGDKAPNETILDLGPLFE